MHLAKTPLADEDWRPCFPKSLLLWKTWFTTGCEWERHQTNRRHGAACSPQDNLSELPGAEMPYVLLGPEIEPVPPGWMVERTAWAFLLMPAPCSSKHLWRGQRRQRGVEWPRDILPQEAGGTVAQQGGDERCSRRTRRAGYSSPSAYKQEFSGVSLPWPTISLLIGKCCLVQAYVLSFYSQIFPDWEADKGQAVFTTTSLCAPIYQNSSKSNPWSIFLKAFPLLKTSHRASATQLVTPNSCLSSPDASWQLPQSIINVFILDYCIQAVVIRAKSLRHPIPPATTQKRRSWRNQGT